MSEPEVLFLNELLENNYYALQNMLADNPVRTGVKRRASCYSKSPKSRARKIKMINEQGGKCKDCREPFKFDGTQYKGATADHVIPFRYGSNLSFNCEFVCNSCNQKREGNRLHYVLAFFGTIE